MRLSSLAIALVLAIAVGATGSAFAQPADPQAPAPSSTVTESATQLTGAPPLAVSEEASGSYILGRDDVIQVSLLGRNDFGGRARVQADGTIQLALIGKIVAAEHTTSELAEVIRKALQRGGYYAIPIAPTART